VLTAPSASFAAPIEVLHRFDINDLIAELKSKIMSRSSAGIKQLAKIFKAMDSNGNGQLDVEDFRWGFIDFGFNLT
jgi:Ca2+-binding EF-hand superfamily protein